MYLPPHELPPKESELMRLQHRPFTPEDLSQQPSYTVPPCPFIHHRLSCLNPAKAREDAASAASTQRSLMNVKLDHILVPGSKVVQHTEMNNTVLGGYS